MWNKMLSRWLHGDDDIDDWYHVSKLCKPSACSFSLFLQVVCFAGWLASATHLLVRLFLLGSRPLCWFVCFCYSSACLFVCSWKWSASLVRLFVSVTNRLVRWFDVATQFACFTLSALQDAYQEGSGCLRLDGVKQQIGSIFSFVTGTGTGTVTGKWS